MLAVPVQPLYATPGICVAELPPAVAVGCEANPELFTDSAETTVQPFLPAPMRAGKTIWLHTPAPLLPQQPAELKALLQQACLCALQPA